MALIVRSRCIKPKTKAPCADCKDRQVGCHSHCSKYCDWINEYHQRKNAIRKHNNTIANAEQYEIIQKQKIMKRMGK